MDLVVALAADAVRPPVTAIEENLMRCIELIMQPAAFNATSKITDHVGR
jgi:hypothetical protein